jgi:hypothetical protein
MGLDSLTGEWPPAQPIRRSLPRFRRHGSIAGAQMMDTLDFVEKIFWYAAGDGAGGNLYLGSSCPQPRWLDVAGRAGILPNAESRADLPPTSTTTLVAEFYKNGILVGTANKLPSGTLYPILSFANNTEAATANFGSSPMAFLPNGISSWDGSQIGAATGTTPAITNGVSVFYPNKIGVYAVGVGNDEPGGAKRSARRRCRKCAKIHWVQSLLHL